MKTIKIKQNAVQIGSDNYLRDYLLTLGILPENVDSFLNEPTITDMDDPYLLDNMRRAVEMVHNACEQNKKFYLQVDCDVDGFTSSAIFYQYIKAQYPDLDIVYDLHEGKEHGIELSHVGEDREIIIVPDAGSMQLEEQKTLAARGCQVVILDHHEVSDCINDDNVVLVNNQYSLCFPNKALSGAGVVLLFIKAYDEKYNDGMYWGYYCDLAAVGIIADMMDTRTIGNNYIINRGLKSVYNKTLQSILQHCSYSIADISEPTKIDVAFYVAPLINGLIRSGKQEEKELFFKALIDNRNDEVFTSEYRGKPRTETIYEYAVRIAANAKSRQDSAKKKGSLLLNQKIKEKHLDDHKIIIVPVTKQEQESVNSTLTGLTAMELLKTYNKPVLVLRENADENGNITYSGSGRSKDFYGMPPLLDFINNSKLAIYGQGHGNAFGASFTAQGLRDFLAYADEKLKDVDFTHDYIEVDYWFKDALMLKVLDDFARGSKIYGNGIPQPKFAFSFTMHSSEFSFIGKNADTIKFTRNGVEFVMFKQPALARELKYSVKSRITCVGRAQINSYNNRPQVIIDSIDIAPSDEVSLLDLI